MKAPATVRFLGSGTSHGVPMIGCECTVCRSNDPRDRRLRPSIYVDVPGRARILVDAGPDLRQQALTHGISQLDAVLFTHGHADHIFGIDELRRFNAVAGGPMPCYANEGTWAIVRQTFPYIFDGKPRLGGGVPKLEPHVLGGPVEIGGVRVVPVPVWHGRMEVLAFRFGTFAYVTDCNRIDEASMELLAGLETLVIDALRDRPHSTHFSLDEALEVVSRLRPARAYTTHMTHELGHAATSARLPPGVELSYDGLVLDVFVDVE